MKGAGRRLTRSGSRNRRARQSTASRGMVNSAMTRADDTVRNLLYMGSQSMKKSVTGIRLRPHAKSSDRTVEAARAHFMGPRT